MTMIVTLFKTVSRKQTKKHLIQSANHKKLKMKMNLQETYGYCFTIVCKKKKSMNE